MARGQCQCPNCNSLSNFTLLQDWTLTHLSKVGHLPFESMDPISLSNAESMEGLQKNTMEARISIHCITTAKRIAKKQQHQL